MAYTSIKAIRFNIGNSIKHICDAEKTALSNAIDYAYNRDKTETTLFESALNCNKDSAYQEMMAPNSALRNKTACRATTSYNLSKGRRHRRSLRTKSHRSLQTS